MNDVMLTSNVSNHTHTHSHKHTLNPIVEVPFGFCHNWNNLDYILNSDCQNFPNKNNTRNSSITNTITRNVSTAFINAKHETHNVEYTNHSILFRPKCSRWFGNKFLLRRSIKLLVKRHYLWENVCSHFRYISISSTLTAPKFKCCVDILDSASNLIKN